MKLVFKLLMVMVFVFNFIGTPVYADDICAANPDARFSSNYNPIARFGGGCYAADPGCSCSVSKVGCGVVLDVTPRDASNVPTNTHEGVTWTCTNFNIGNTTGPRCFHPRGTYTGTGMATCTVTASTGTRYTFTFGSGGGSMSPTSSGSPPGDLGEKDVQCAYREGSQQICVDGTEASNEADCTAHATCVAKGGCTLVDRSICNRLQPSVSTTPLNNPPASDLGQLIKKVFDFSLSIVGLTVFVMTIYGGFLMLLAGGMPSMHARGKGIITNAFLGALLLFAAYVILNTINPNLVQQRGALPTLPPAQVPNR